MFGSFFRKKQAPVSRAASPFSAPSGVREKDALPPGGRGEPLSSRDTRSAIEELSHVVKDNPEAVEIYLALGSLYRAQGEIERAIQIRNNLIHRHGLDPRFKARVLLELGRDFRRGGFLDRAAQALAEARKLAGDNRDIILEQAELGAQSAEWEEAAAQYAELGMALHQAHYLVRLGRDCFERGDAQAGQKFLKRALKVYSASPEAWMEQLAQEFQAGNCSRLAGVLRKALAAVEPDMRFLLLDGLIETATRGAEAVGQDEADDDVDAASGGCISRGAAALLCEAVVPVLREQEPDVLLQYYGARLLLLCGDAEEANVWLEKTLMLQPDFWLARLELLELSMDRQNITSFFQGQLEFFIDQARKVRKFVCKNCGLKRDSLFYVCPRCRNWHTIVFRRDISR